VALDARQGYSGQAFLASSPSRTWCHFQNKDETLAGREHGALANARMKAMQEGALGSLAFFL
jgi:hypothetical protein